MLALRCVGSIAAAGPGRWLSAAAGKGAPRKAKARNAKQRQLDANLNAGPTGPGGKIYHSHIKNPIFADELVTLMGNDIVGKTVIEYKPGFGVLSDALLRAGARSVVSIVKETGVDAWHHGKHYHTELDQVRNRHGDKFTVYSGEMSRLDRRPTYSQTSRIPLMPYSEKLLAGVERCDWASDDCNVAFVTLMTQMNATTTASAHPLKIMTQFMFWMNRRDRFFHWGRATCFFVVTREMAQYFIRDSNFTRNALLAKVTAEITCLGAFNRAALELVGDATITGAKPEGEKAYTNDLMLLKLTPQRAPMLDIDLVILDHLARRYMLGRRSDHELEALSQFTSYRTVVEMMGYVCLGADKVVKAAGINKKKTPADLTLEEHCRLAVALKNHDFAPDFY